MQNLGRTFPFNVEGQKMGKTANKIFESLRVKTS